MEARTGRRRIASAGTGPPPSCDRDLRELLSLLRRRARDAGIPDGRSGAVVVTQRFDSALRLDPHFHALVLDGIYTGLARSEAVRFQGSAPWCDAEIAWLVRHVRTLVLSHLVRCGRLDANHRLLEEPSDLADPLRACHAAAVQGRLATGEWAEVFGELRDPGPRPRKKLCADVGGFSLHAAVCLSAGRRDRLERLCRYVCRPPLAVDRVRLSRDGKVVCSFRKPWRNGVEGARLDPLTFLSRLAALVPPPRAHLLTYHGVLAAASPYRDRVVPEQGEEGERDGCRHDLPDRGPEPVLVRGSRKVGPRRNYYRWAELLKRVFAVDVLKCGGCGGRRKVLAFLTEPRVVERILTHLGLSPALPAVAPARAPPGVLPLS
jgi:hypothetical protein